MRLRRNQSESVTLDKGGISREKASSKGETQRVYIHLATGVKSCQANAFPDLRGPYCQVTTPDGRGVRLRQGHGGEEEGEGSGRGGWQVPRRGEIPLPLRPSNDCSGS